VIADAAGVGGLAYATTGIGLERVTGIEPAPSAWEADVLPLNYTRGCRKPYTKAPDSGGSSVAAPFRRVLTTRGRSYSCCNVLLRFTSIQRHRAQPNTVSSKLMFPAVVQHRPGKRKPGQGTGAQRAERLGRSA
jgi:hypothetical protein